MVARVLALALAMVMTASANCHYYDKSKEFKPSTKVEFCEGGDYETCTTDKCDCDNCCQPIPDTCYHKSVTGSTCFDGKEYDESKKAEMVSVEPYRPYETTCCKNKSVAVRNCLNMKWTAQYTNNFCADGVEGVSVAKSLNAVKDDASDYKAQCCAPKVMCGTNFTCSTAGMKLDTAKAGHNCSDVPCSESECCIKDTTKCLGLTPPSTGCGDGKFRDPAKAGVAAKQADFVEKCCSEAATCHDFSSSIGSASASTRQHAVTLSLVLAGVAAMGKSL